MAHQARDNRISRRSWLVTGLALPLFRARAAEETPLRPVFDGDNLQLKLPLNFHFLSGKPLERLNGGNTVSFLARMSLLTDDKHTIIKESPVQPFILSMDIWDRTFKVTAPNLMPRDRTGLTAPQAESWCLENIYISTTSVPQDRPLWLQWTMKTRHQDDLSQVIGDRGISLSNLVVEYFSRKTGVNDAEWTYQTSHSFRLQDLPRMLFGRSNRLG